MPYKDKNSPAAKESARRRHARWVEKNRDKVNEYNRTYNKRDKDGKWRVYLLPNELYVGQTSGVYGRMCGHRKDGRNTDDYIILHICDTELESLALERIYHDIGFIGRHRFMNNSVKYY